jgi:hypothetical protein
MSTKKIAQIHWKTFAGRYIVERTDKRLLEVGMLVCPQTLKGQAKCGRGRANGTRHLPGQAKPVGKA